MKIPRIMIAGASSGSGKTTAVCAILSLLKRRDIKVKALKCGPDYIDTMFHKAVTGVPCSNLDTFFADDNMLKYLLYRNSGEQITVIEGVMGFYDGTGQSGTDNSTYTVSEITETPVILTVDAKGASASLLAVIEGFLSFAPNNKITGVIFNRISSANYCSIKKLMEERFGKIILPIGYIPTLPEELSLPSRHLGLVPADEISDLAERLNKTADLCENTIDLDLLLKIADSASELRFSQPNVPKFDKINIAAAYDNAFCFYYSDTFRLFEDMGAKLRFFSPLKNEPVPENSNGLLLGGGYPELYAEKLEKNEIAKESVRCAVVSGMPTISECGGFQYLGKELNGRKMCGVLEHSTSYAGKLIRFGYVTLTSQKSGLFGNAGTVLRAHEFHYFDSTGNGNAFKAVKPNGQEWECAVLTNTLYAGYPHLFLPSNIQASTEFYKKCLKYKESKNDNHRSE